MRGGGQAARVHFLAGSFRILSPGDHVVCAVTGAPIALEELRYWSVARQQAYASPAASLAAEQRRAEQRQGQGKV